MSNPLHDPFSAAADGLLQAFALELPVQVHPLWEPTGADEVMVDGRVGWVSGAALNIEVRPAAPLAADADAVWWLVFEYRLQPGLVALQRHAQGRFLPAQLSARDRPWPWSPNPAGWAIAFVELPVPAQGLERAVLSWGLRAAPGQTLRGADFQLQHFRCYKVQAFDMDMHVTGAGPGRHAWSMGGLLGYPGPLARVDLPTQVDPLAADPACDVRIELRGRTSGVAHSFQGRVHPASVDGGLSWTSAIVFPVRLAEEGLSGFSTADAWCALLEYLAVLDAYRRPAAEVLSLEQAALLEADRPLWPLPAAVALPPVSPPRLHRFATRLPYLSAYWAQRVGGAEAPWLARHLRLAQALGHSAVMASTAGAGWVAAWPALRDHGLSLAHIDYDWRTAFEITTGGRLRQPMGNDLGKNPLQLDALALGEAATRFAQDWPLIDQVASTGRLVVHTPELGDTYMGMAFTLQRAQADIDHVNRQLMAALIYRSPDGAEVTLEGCALEADQQYQAGWRLALIDDAQRWAERLQALDLILRDRLLAGPLRALRDELAQRVAVAQGLAALSTHPELRPVVDFGPVDALRLATNGVLDSFPYSRPPDYPRQAIGERMPPPSSPVADRAAWACAMRYWNHANIAYLQAAVAALALPMKPLGWSHSTNLSKPLGYGSGYEAYHALRSGALDVVWLHDQTSRSSGPDGGNHLHLLFAGVAADFARACARVRSPLAPLRSGPREIGVYLASDRVDLKALVWASRGASLFEVYAACDAYTFPADNGYCGTGDVALQFGQQTQRITRVLHAVQAGLADAQRAPAQVALLVAQSDSLWNAWSDTPGDNHGFVAGRLLNPSLHGLHALFTQRHLAVDFVFEEALLDDPQCLDHYAVLVSTAKLLRDDIYLEVARWVEVRGGVWLCAAGALELQEDAATVGAAFNECFELRPARLAWLGLPDAQPPAATQLRVCGEGRVLLPAETLAGACSAETLIGQRCIEGLDLRYGHFVNPPTPWGDADGAALFDTLDALVREVRLATQGQALSLTDARPAWVTQPDGSPEPFVELVCLQGPGGNAAREGVLVLIDHRARATLPSPDERWTPIGEAERVPRRVKVCLPGLPAGAVLRCALGTATAGAGHMMVDGLQDYEVIHWRA